ncbi:hypothetical protein QE152_g21558 [Popillia japonica]|uniref:Uncharacterized protein n=1 Tax=Popillia japonica TaxID=7064 RepID=A0AAW1KLC6_POPJA
MSLKPSTEFIPGQQPAEAWQKWRDTFELYVTATELNSKPKEQKRALFLYVIGPVGYQIYETYKFNKEKSEVTAENILEAINTYYKPYKNTTYKFNKEKSEVTAENILEAINTYYKPYKNTTYIFEV